MRRFFPTPLPVAAIAAVLTFGSAIAILAQGRGGGLGKGGGKGGPGLSAREQAPIDLTGYWVSLVTEDWLYRMVTPPKLTKSNKDAVASIPLTPAAQNAAMAWDPAADEAAGKQCLAYGPYGVIRLPGRLHIEWVDDQTLKVEKDYGTQTRLLHFGGTPTGPATLQGYSVASWEGLGRGGRGTFGVPPGATGDANAGKATPTQIRPGHLHVVTTLMTPGYLRKNGVPYSANMVLTENWDIVHQPDGTQYLIVSSVVEDPVNLTQPWRTSTHFKKEPDGSKFKPSPCTVR